MDRRKVRLRRYGMPRFQSGMALALLMVMLAALSLLVMGLTRQARLDVKLTQVFLARAQAAAVAEGAGHLAMQDVLQSSTTQGERIDLPARLRYELGGYPVAVEVTSQAGLVDVNSASRELLLDVLRLIGGLDERDAQRMVATIEDSRQDLRLGSANAPQALRVLEDLLALEGMDRLVYERIAPVLSISGGGALPDPSMAPEALLVALAGGDRQQARQWIRARDQGVAAGSTPGGSGIGTSGFDLVVVVTMPDGSRLSRRLAAVADVGGLVPWRFTRLHPVIPVETAGASRDV